MSFDQERLKAVAEKCNSIHATDPSNESAHYHALLVHWVTKLSNNAPSEPLLLAANAQHIKRWTVPRSSFPEGLAGYKRWRASLAKFHADELQSIMKEAGYSAEDESDAPLFHKVRDLIQKRGLGKEDEVEVQLFEDAICLVFLQLEFEKFVEKISEEKMISVLQKTWVKMSDNGHRAALELVETLPSVLRDLVLKALSN